MNPCSPSIGARVADRLPAPVRGEDRGTHPTAPRAGDLPLPSLAIMGRPPLARERPPATWCEPPCPAGRLDGEGSRATHRVDERLPRTPAGSPQDPCRQVLPDRSPAGRLAPPSSMQAITGCIHRDVDHVLHGANHHEGRLPRRSRTGQPGPLQRVTDRQRDLALDRIAMPEATLVTGRPDHERLPRMHESLPRQLPHPRRERVVLIGSKAPDPHRHASRDTRPELHPVQDRELGLEEHPTRLGSPLDTELRELGSKGLFEPRSHRREAPPGHQPPCAGCPLPSAGHPGVCC